MDLHNILKERMEMLPDHKRGGTMGCLFFTYEF